EAKVGSGTTLGSSGSITVDAHTMGAGNLATADAEGGVGGGVVGVAVMVAKAHVDGAVRAELDAGVTSSSAVLVTANIHNDAEATTLVVAIAAFSGAGSGADATVGGHATTEALAGDPTIVTTGLVHLTATSDNTANASSDGGTGGAVSIGVNLPSATIAGGTRAELDASVSGGPGVTVEASGTNTATASALIVSI